MLVELNMGIGYTTIPNKKAIGIINIDGNLFVLHSELHSNQEIFIENSNVKLAKYTIHPLEENMAEDLIEDIEFIKQKEHFKKYQNLVDLKKKMKEHKYILKELMESLDESKGIKI